MPSRLVQVSPRHWVTLGEDFLGMIDTAPREDFVVQTLARRKAGTVTLMMGELVIAGAATRATFEGAREFPLHFRKTYYPGRLGGDPREEFRLHALASSLIPVPHPLGATRDTFRSCLIPGVPLNRTCDLGVEPDPRNIEIARELSLAAAAGLWKFAEETLQLIDKLQAGGLSHGDTHLHNFIVCPSPLEVIPIDFEIAKAKEDCNAETWEARCAAEREHVFKLAIYLQSALGRGQGPLAERSLEVIEQLVTSPKLFQQAIEERTFDAKAHARD
jgi:hypothetical protein